MISEIVYASLLLSACVTIHAAMLAWLARGFRKHPDLNSSSFLNSTWLLIQLAWWILLTHLLEISLWALFYWWKDLFPNPDEPFYFSAVTYTTVGYGDIVPDREWRILAGIEGLTGILMCGWSTGFVFAAFSRILKPVVSHPATSAKTETA